MRRKPLRRIRRRAGFSLIELLAVIVILSIMVALLLPAVMNARRAARVTQVKTEIGSLAGAIGTFKQEFGIEPPSFIVLSETGDSGSTINWPTASKAMIGRLWPQFNFTFNHDFNLDGDTSDTITLYGAACLVFFLGGPTSWVDANSNGAFDSSETIMPLAGFSRNPANPFSPLPASGAGNRQGPFFTFDVNRLVADPLNTNFYGFSDPLSGTPAPYLYVSSYEGQGYNPADFGTGALVDAYRNGTSTTSAYFNPSGYQLISAGFDRAYGIGGPYQKGNLPGWTSAVPVTYTIADRYPEADNITNFSDGLLAP